MAVVAAGVMLTFAGCGGDGSEQTELPEAGGESADNESPSEPSASPSEASPTDGSTSGSTPGDQRTEIASEHPEAGLRYEPPEAEGAEAEILQAFLTFESERWIAQRDTREVSEVLESVATKDLLDQVSDSFAYQRDSGIRYTGAMIGEDVRGEQPGDQSARVVTCYDGFDVVLEVEGEGEQQPEGQAQVRGNQANVSAEVDTITYSAPTAETVECAGFGAQDSDECSLVSERASAHLPGQVTPVTAETAWSIDWTYNGEPQGELDPQTTSQTFDIPVAEIQTTVTD